MDNPNQEIPYQTRTLISIGDSAGSGTLVNSPKLVKVGVILHLLNKKSHSLMVSDRLLPVFDAILAEI